MSLLVVSGKKNKWVRLTRIYKMHAT